VEVTDNGNETLAEREKQRKKESERRGEKEW
jgi:hypothetical protein